MTVANTEVALNGSQTINDSKSKHNMTIQKVFRIGVDVGGTNTDCVVLHTGEADQPNRGIRSAFKTPTTPDVTEGITKAIDGALAQCKVSLDSIAAVMIGTTVRVSSGLEGTIRSSAPSTDTLLSIF